MKIKYLPILLLFSSLILFSCRPSSPVNGWYFMQNETVTGKPIVTVKDFFTFRLDSTISDQGDTVFVIVGQLKPEKHSAFAEATEKSIGKTIGFLHNGEIITSPQVNARIDSGRFQIASPDRDIRNIYKQLGSEMDSIFQQEYKKIAAENERRREEAQKLRFTDADFLQTKQPMSDDAIAPYDYQTGIVGDRAYNARVYMVALERAKKYLRAENNRLILTIQSGSEINIAEDLFEYIVDLFKDWNKWIGEGRFEIIQTDEGYYDLSPTTR